MKRRTLSVSLIICFSFILSACGTSRRNSNPAPVSSGPVIVKVSGGVYTAQGSGKAISEPFDLPKGTYRLTLTTDDSFMAASIDDVTKEFNCTGIASTDQISRVTTVEGQVTSRGCRAVLILDPAESTWNVELRPLK